MIALPRRIPDVWLKAYTVAAIAAAVGLAPIAYSFAPVLVLLWYVFQWRRRVPPLVSLLSEWLAFTSIGLFLSRSIGVLWATVLATPVLILVIARLEEFAALRPGLGRPIAVRRRRLTDTGTSLAFVAAALLLVAFLVGSPPLAVACIAILALLLSLTILARLGFQRQPIVERQVSQRMVAGSRATFRLEFAVHATTGGRLYLDSTHEWVKLNPSVLSLASGTQTTMITLSPSLSGPNSVKLGARAVDRWGLIESDFEMEPVRLEVIPRARYAAWLVQRYMAGSRPGTLPIFANVGTISPLHGWRRGIEYYGSRLYQPGDSLKSIDWKHSLQHGELSAKEFSEFTGRPAVLLVNLVAAGAEQKDKLAYSVASTALSLAREGIPTAFATYDRSGVRFTTVSLGPERLLSTSLNVIRQITTTTMSPQRFLSPPDVGRLRGNIMRLSSVHSPASEVLSQLLKSEYESLKQASLMSPVSMALANVMRKVDKESNVIVISSAGSDSDALEFTKYSLRQRGNHVMTLHV